MTTTPAPDVDRVLDRMGRSTIGYRSFPHPDAAFPRPARDADAADSEDATVLFGLIGDALAAAACGDATAQAAVSVNPFLTPMPTPTAAATLNPFLAPPASPVRRASLAEMFRMLSGDAARPVSRGDAGRQETVFPFRRR